MRALIFLLFSSVLAVAQTTVTGTIVDPNGNSYANGTAAAYTVATSGQPTTSTSPVATNSAGLFTLSLPANTYVFTICAPPTGLGPTQNPTPTQVCFTSSPIAISGPSQDVSTQLNALAKVIGPNRNITGNAVAPVSRTSIQAGATADVQLSNAITALAGGSGIVWSDYSTNQTWAACPTWGSGSVHVLLYPVAYTVAVNCTIPSTVTLEFTQGACLSTATGIIATMNGTVLAGKTKIFCNALSGQGAVDFTGGTLNEKIYPEWWGAVGNNSAGGVETTNTSAIQAAIYGAFGCNTSPTTSCRTNASGLSNNNRILWFSDIYFINGTLNCYHWLGARLEGENQLLTGISQAAANSPILNCQSISDTDIGHLRFSTSASQNDALIKLDYNTSQGTDLAVENVTLHDLRILGNGVGQIGVIVAPSGGGSQGDNVRFINNFAASFTQSCYQIGGNNTGINAGRFYATNAIQIQFIGGDIQGCKQYGIASYGGSYTVIGTSFENNVNGNANQTGVDMYCEGVQGFDRCKMDRVRSEGLRLAAGGPWTIIDSFITAGWCTTFDNVAGLSEPLNQLISGTWVGGDGKCYQVTVSGTFGGLQQTTPTSASATTLVNSGASYTTNAFVGYKASIMLGTDKGCYGIVTANNATTITFSGGLATDYDSTSGITCTATPDTSSKFVVEPNWGSQTTSGGATFALFDFNCIDGGFLNGTTGPPSGSNVGASFILNNVGCYNGRINVKGSFTGLTVTRADWMPTSSAQLEDTVETQFHNGTLVERVGIPSSTYNVPWAYPRNGITSAKNYSQMQIGTLPICWAQGGTGGGVSTVDICTKAVPNAGSKNGSWQILNNSSGTLQTWNFNANGATQFPGSTSAIGSGVSTNTDLTGVLSFSAATTSSTYTFTGTYTSAPDCQFTPTFDYGSGNRIWWSTLSTTTLQASSNVAQTGSIVYSCNYRN